MKDTTSTDFKCENQYCGHIGTAIGDLVTDYHGDGRNETTLQDLQCEACGSDDIRELVFAPPYYVNTQVNLTACDRVQEGLDEGFAVFGAVKNV